VDVQAVSGFAKEFYGQHKKKYIEVERLAGFCLLIRREVLTRVGTALDAWTDLSLFDTDILSAKAREEGFSRWSAATCSCTVSARGPFARGAPQPLAESNGRRS
jgi:hypothetical protein